MKKKNSCVIIKHNIPCGAAISTNQTTAFELALKCDQQSAFGGIIGFNKILNGKTALLISKFYFEAIIARGYDKDALNVLSAKKNLRLLQLPSKLSKTEERSFFAGKLFQEANHKKTTLKVLVGNKKNITSNINFFIKILNSVKSNAIIIFDDNALLAQAGGQTSRVDAVKIALNKCAKLKVSNQKRLYLASDAFFPFIDNLKLINKSNKNIILIVPMGSINDSKIINYCKENRISLIQIDNRYFKH